MRESLLLLLLFAETSLFSALFYPVGARFAGMSHCGVMISDLWSISHNQAGLASMVRPAAGFHHENHFLIKEMGISAAAVALPVRPGIMAVQYQYFGHEKYHETRTSLAYAMKLGETVSAGIQISYFSQFIQYESSRTRAVTAEGGILYHPAEHFSIGFHVFNPNQSSFQGSSGERLPSVVQFGAGYISGKIIFCAETEKQSGVPPCYKMAMEYHPVTCVFFRAGLSTHPMYLYSMGLGLTMKKIRMDVASSFHQILGFSPHFSLTFFL